MNPLINIHFCGSGIEGSRSHFASLKALSAVKNRLILSGVGAPPIIHPQTQAQYPTPGTFVVCELQQILKWSHPWVVGAIRIAGWILGYGERQNLNWALANIEYKMNACHLPVYIINLSGYSRGGTTAIYLAHLLQQRYGSLVRINLFLIDPNAGFGQHHCYQKRVIPKNVMRLYRISNRDERIPCLRPRAFSHFKLENPQLHFVDMSMKGNHLAQEKLTIPPDMTSPAFLNYYLLATFYESFAINHIKESIIDLGNDDLRVEQAQWIHRKTHLDQVISAISRCGGDPSRHVERRETSQGVQEMLRRFAPQHDGDCGYSVPSC